MTILYKDDSISIDEKDDKILIILRSGGQVSLIELKKNTSYATTRFHLIEEG